MPFSAGTAAGASAPVRGRSTPIWMMALAGVAFGVVEVHAASRIRAAPALLNAPARIPQRMTPDSEARPKGPRRIFGAHAAHLRVQLLRCSLTHGRCARSAARSFTRIWATWIAESLVEVFGRASNRRETIAPVSKDNLRVLLVDDHEVVRDGVKALINANDDLTVVGEAGSVQEAIDQAMRTKPDVVVMDVRLADGSGIVATREIRARLENTQVLMLTSFADDEALFASIMAGAAGYVLKQIRGGELIRAIREVGAGRSLLDPEVTRSVLDRLRKGK